MMIIIARGAARGWFGHLPLALGPSRRGPGARQRCATQRGEGGRAPRALRGVRGGHHTAGDGEAARTGGGRKGEAGPAVRNHFMLGRCSSPRNLVKSSAVGGTAGRSPPQWGAGEGGSRGDERGGGVVAGASAGGGEKEQRAGESARRRVMAGLYM
jgi:hypothetical protein